jgi:signal transduction histidine kinase
MTYRSFYRSFEQGRRSLEGEDPLKALLHFHAALLQNPYAEDAYLGRATARAWLGDSQGALADFHRALALTLPPSETAECAHTPTAQHPAEPPCSDDLAADPEAVLCANEWIALLAHELRTPLNPILGFVQLLRRGSLEPTAQEQALAAIERNGRLLVQMIEDLLDTSRIANGRFAVTPSPIEIVPAVEAALQTVLPLAHNKGVTVTVLLDPTTGEVFADRTRLMQVVWNLVINAIKFTPGGGRVELTLQRVGPCVSLRVRDTGIGIDPQSLPHVFERFFRGRGSSGSDGLGLGLFIVRHIVEAHGGTVEVSSDGVGQGTLFTVALPVADGSRRLVVDQS